MSVFRILSRTPDSWRPLMGFMNEKGVELIEPQFLNGPWGIGRHFSRSGFAVVERPGQNPQLVIDVHGKTVFELPKNHSSGTGVLNGILGVTHRVNGDDTSLWERCGRDMYFLGETRYHAMRLDGSIAFDGYICGEISGRYVFRKSLESDDKKGIVDQTGNPIVPAIYDAIYTSNCGMYVTVWKDKQANVLSLDGRPVFRRPFEVRELHDLKAVTGGLLIVPNYQKRRADVFDVASAELIGRLPTTYWSKSIPRAYPTIAGGVVHIGHPRKGSKYLYPDGTAVMPGFFERPHWFKPEFRTGYFHDNRASFKVGEWWGYINLEGEQIIPPQFKSNLPFRDGLARVKFPNDEDSWDRFSYIDTSGDIVWHQEN